jgi:hypothetical protein
MAGGWRTGEAILATADHHFPMPSGSTALWDRRGATGDEAVRLVEKSVAELPDAALAEMGRHLPGSRRSEQAEGQAEAS